MNIAHRLLAFLTAALAVLAAVPVSAASQKEARVTQVVRDVKLLPSEAEVRPAAMNDRVPEDTAVRTGDKSRSELTFADLTISRLGANTIYSYNKGGRSIDLSGGSVLLRVPKDSGGASVRSTTVSVAVSGTTLILESARGGRSKLLVLEGNARLGLIKYPAETRTVQAGQMLDVPAGATTLPMPVNIDLKRTIKEHPLVAGFPPLPSQGLIMSAAEKQAAPGADEPVYQGQPVAGQPAGIGPAFPGLGLPPGPFGGSGNAGNPRGPRNPGNRGKGETRNPPVGVKQPPPRGKKPPPKPNDPRVG